MTRSENSGKFIGTYEPYVQYKTTWASAMSIQNGYWKLEIVFDSLVRFAIQEMLRVKSLTVRQWGKVNFNSEELSCMNKES